MCSPLYSTTATPSPVSGVLQNCVSTVLEGGLSVPVMPHHYHFGHALCLCTSWRIFFIYVYVYMHIYIYIWPLFPSAHKSNDVAACYYLTTLGWSPSNPSLKHPFCCLATFGVYVTELWQLFSLFCFHTVLCQTVMIACTNAFKSRQTLSNVACSLIAGIRKYLFYEVT